MVVSVIALASTAFLTFNFAEKILRERVGDQLISESSTRGNSIRSIFDTRITETQILATDPMIQNLVNQLNDISQNDNLESKIKEKRRDFLIEVKGFQELAGYSIGFDDVKIIGKNGKSFFSLKLDSKDDFSQDAKFIQGLKGSFVKIEPSENGDRHMVVVTPIFGTGLASTSEPIGVMIGTMNTAEIDSILLNRSGLGKTGEVYLVDDNFQMISESRFVKSAAFNQRVDTMPVRKCFEQGQEVGDLYQDYRGVKIYGFSYCARDLGFVLLAEIDESETFQPVLILQNWIFLTGLSVTAVMAVITYFLSRLVSRPIIKLRNAANEIAKGNFETRTNIKRSDEIGQLSSSFDLMAKKLQESIIAIKQREDVIKQQQDLLLQFSDQSESYYVGIVDVIGSTKITAKISDLDASRLYGIFLNSMAAIVRNFGGIVVKNIGDALLFYFPKTNTRDQAALRKALECCLAIRDYHKEINEKLQAERLPTVDYKISATYGTVRVAIIATSSIDDIFGSTVNKCAKINRLAPPNGIAIGEVLYQLVKSFNEYDFEIIDNPATESEYGIVYSVTRKKIQTESQLYT
ncbi:MAG: HAMP domain-containing protein [Thaumarchaeota archaeon]|nr:HAMP domain-containing protein [Nitrososphaerota archaeon]